MVLCFDTTGTIYAILAGMTTNVTGSLFLTTLLIAILLMSIASMFSIPVEFTAIFLLPLHLSYLACFDTGWLAITGIILIYLGILLAKNFFFRN